MEISIILQVIADPTRYKIVMLLTEKHHCSRSLSKTLGISESAVSQHMTQLKHAGVVTSFKHGYHVHYVLNEIALKELKEAVEQWIVSAQAIEDCHDNNPCQFKIQGNLDGLNESNGCLYAKCTKKGKCS